MTKRSTKTKRKRRPVDPVDVLRQIAGNRKAPAHARVSAAKALIMLSRPADGGALVPIDGDARDVPANDAISQRALAILARGRTLN
jgi:hypothetical protein